MIAIACGKCRRTNPPARKFCGECGTPLWDKCDQCSAEVPPQERFCGQCGCDVRGLHAQKLAELQAELQAAETALDEHRYDDARWQLRDLEKVSDPRFIGIAERARVLLAGLESRKATAIAATDHAMGRAKQLVEAHEYDQAIAVLERTPAILRSSEMQAMLASALAMRNEAAALAGEIRAAVAAKQYAGLLTKLARLLCLKPDHATARKLAEQLRDQCIAKARRCLAEHQYDAAAAVLETIPPSLEVTDYQKLLDKAKELACLSGALRTAPLADRTTLAIGERLANVTGNGEQVAELVKKLQVRVQQKPANPRLVAPDWTLPPRRTAFGAPVDWLGHLPTFRGVPTAMDVLAKHPGRFAVALGLALEGLGAAKIAINHAPKAEKASLLGALTMPLTGKRGNGASWGLDLSPAGLKAVKLVRDPRSGAIEVVAAEYLPHAKTLTNPEAELEQRELAGKTLQTFVEKHSPNKLDFMVGGLPGHQTLGRFFELPPMPSKKVASAVEFEARHQLPIALEDLAWGYAILNPEGGKEADSQPRRIVLSAARQYHAAERSTLFQAFGISLDRLQSDCVALYNAAAHEFLGSQEGTRNGSICLVDVGVEGTNFVMAVPDGTWFRSVRLGTHDLVSATVKQFQLTYPQAEMLHREPSRARRLYELLATWKPWIEQLACEVGKSLDRYRDLAPQEPVHHIYGLGDGFATFGLMERLRMG